VGYWTCRRGVRCRRCRRTADGAGSQPARPSPARCGPLRPGAAGPANGCPPGRKAAGSSLQKSRACVANPMDMALSGLGAAGCHIHRVGYRRGPLARGGSPGPLGGRRPPITPRPRRHPAGRMRSPQISRTPQIQRRCPSAVAVTAADGQRRRCADRRRRPPANHADSCAPPAPPAPAVQPEARRRRPGRTARAPDQRPDDLPHPPVPIPGLPDRPPATSSPGHLACRHAGICRLRGGLPPGIIGLVLCGLVLCGLVLCGLVLCGTGAR
jgi:hypothetical protein